MSFPFKDQEWGLKSLIGVLFMILGVVGVGIPIVAGYLTQTTQRVMRREPEALPAWTDVGVMFVLGFKFCVVYFLYMLPAFMLYLPFAALAVLGGLSENSHALGVLAGTYLVFVVFVFVIPYSLLITVLAPIFAFRFAERERISDALDIATVFRIFRLHWKDTLIIALIGIALSIAACFGLIFLIVGVLFMTLYTYLVMAHMNGLLYLEHKRVETAT